MQLPKQAKVRHEVKDSHVIRHLNEIAPPHDVLKVDVGLNL